MYFLLSFFFFFMRMRLSYHRNRRNCLHRICRLTINSILSVCSFTVLLSFYWNILNVSKWLNNRIWLQLMHHFVQSYLARKVKQEFHYIVISIALYSIVDLCDHISAKLWSKKKRFPFLFPEERRKKPF